MKLVNFFGTVLLIMLIIFALFIHNKKVEKTEFNIITEDNRLIE